MEKISYEKIQKPSKKTETVFGDPIPFNTFTIIPVARVKYAPEGDREDEKTPLGYIEIKEDKTRYISFYDPSEMLLLGGLSGMGLAGAGALLKSIFAGLEKRGEEKTGTKTGVVKEKSHEEHGACCRDVKKVMSVVGVTLGLVSMALTLSKVFARSKNPLQDITTFITSTFLSPKAIHEEREEENSEHWENATKEVIDETPGSMTE